MDTKRERIAEFSDFLNREVMDTVEQNIPFSTLGNSRKMLVFQSTASWIIDGVFEQLLKENSDIQLVILGRDDCKYMQDKFENRVEWLEHNKNFADDDIENVKRIVNECGIDGLLFFNNFVNCVDFSNVEHVAMFVEQQVPVYSYSYVQRELNKHNNIAKHIYGEILYKDLLEWYKTIR